MRVRTLGSAFPWPSLGFYGRDSPAPHGRRPGSRIRQGLIGSPEPENFPPGAQWPALPLSTWSQGHLSLLSG